MPTLETTLPLLGRIRAGDRSGKSKAPKRLERFRLTSDNKPRLEYAKSLGWGNEVVEWPDAPEGRQWQLYCSVDSLTVVVPQAAAFSQYDEIWSGAECIYRCDGTRVVKIQPHKDYPSFGEPDGICEGMACVCEEFEGRVPTVTRISLFLPELPGIGVWRLDTRGFYAGGELQGITQMLEEASRRGMYIEADLAISQRKRRSAGQSRIFPVPTLQPKEMTMGQILQLKSTQKPKAIAPPSNEDVFGGRGLAGPDLFEQTARAEALAAKMERDRPGLIIDIGKIKDVIPDGSLSAWWTSQFGIATTDELSDDLLRRIIGHFKRYGYGDDALTRDLDSLSE